MRPTNLRRAPLVLALGLLPLLIARSHAGDDGVTRTHSAGYPRCSDVPPTPLEQAPEGHGEENDTTGTQYDTNLLLDASRGESDAVWMIVREACIDGGGRVVDSDVSSATHKRQDAWGEDRLQFQASGGAAGGSITVRNRLSVSAAWVLAGNGRNSAVMLGKMVDIYGKVHEYQCTRSVSPASTTTEVTTDLDTSNQSNEVEIGLQEDGASAGTTGGTQTGQSEGRTTTTTTTDGSTDAGDDSWSLEISKTVAGSTCSIVIASSATIDVKAQALTDGIETSTDVTEFNVHNIVDAAYVAPTSGGGPNTGGGNTGGPNTGGGNGTGPATGGDDGSGPRTPGDDDESPLPPGDDDEDEPAVPPDDGSTPGDSSGTDATDGGADTSPDDDPVGDEPIVLPPFCGGVIVCGAPPAREGPVGGELRPQAAC